MPKPTKKKPVVSATKAQRDAAALREVMELLPRLLHTQPSAVRTILGIVKILLGAPGAS